MFKGLFDGTRALHKAGLGHFLKSETFGKDFYKRVFSFLSSTPLSPVVFVSGNHAEVPWFIKEVLKDRISSLFFVLNRAEYSEQKLLFSKCGMEVKRQKIRIIVRDSQFSGQEALRRWSFPVDLGLFTSPDWIENEVLKISSHVRPGGELFLKKTAVVWQKHLVRDRLGRVFSDAEPVSGFYHFRRW